MFLVCPFTKRKCAFCGEYEKEILCGMAKGENKIKWLTKCPKKKVW